MPKATPLPTALSLAELRQCWTRIVGAQIAAVSWPQMLADSKLIVHTCGPWASELQQLTPAMIATLPTVDGVTITAVKWIYAPPPTRAPSPYRTSTMRIRR